MGKKHFDGAKYICQFCNKEGHELPFLPGDNEGVGGTLGDNMLKNRSKHRMYAGVNSLEAHHIIVSECMRGNNNPWAVYVNRCGYDINHKNNGVFLTNFRSVACKLATPLHDGSHDLGETDKANINYATLMKNKVKGIEGQIARAKYCQNVQAVRNKLDNLSKTTLQKLSDFDYSLTKEGKCFKKGKKGCGCGNRKNHKILGMDFSAEHFVRTQLKAKGYLKEHLMQSVVLSNERFFNPTANDPLVVGQ